MGSTTLNKITLRYEGLFDFNEMYAFLIDWAKTYRYKWHEAAYKHKADSSGAEQEYSWMLDKLATEYFIYLIQINAHTWNMKDVEVEIDGKKKILTNARISIEIIPTVKTDWQGQFKGEGFIGKLGKWYEERVAQKKIKDNMGILYFRVWNLHAKFKEFFDMQSKKNRYKNMLRES